MQILLTTHGFTATFLDIYCERRLSVLQKLWAKNPFTAKCHHKSDVGCQLHFYLVLSTDFRPSCRSHLPFLPQQNNACFSFLQTLRGRKCPTIFGSTLRTVGISEGAEATHAFTATCNHRSDIGFNYILQKLWVTHDYMLSYVKYRLSTTFLIGVIY